MSRSRHPGATDEPRRVRRLLGAGFALAVLFGATVTPLQESPAVAQAGVGLEPLGLLSLGDIEGLVGVRAPVLGIHEESQRLYTAVSERSQQYAIAEYDLGTDIPALLRMTDPFLESTLTASPATTFVDTAANRMILLVETAFGGLGDPFLQFVDLKDLQPTGRWEVSQRVPGFNPFGMTYDPGRDLIYLVGVIEGQRQVAIGGTLTGSTNPNAVVVALNGQSGDLVWLQRLAGCDSPLRNSSKGALIALNANQSALYTFCAAGVTAYQPTGQAGLIRVDVSDQSGVGGVADFPTEFFPVSGRFADFGAQGITAFDPLRERFYVHSLSDRTHGAWVFDGVNSAWVGFVAALDGNNRHVGLDLATGKHYMAGGAGPDSPTAYINVTSGSATPVPQGQTFNDIRVQLPTGREARVLPISDLIVDGRTGRVFVGVQWEVTDEEKRDDFHTHDYGYAVLRDHTGVVTPLPPLELDTLTHDLPDDKARLELSANTSGFGVQYIKVGGWENLWSRPTAGPYDAMLRTIVGSLYSGLDNPAEIRYGNRGVTMSLVEGIGIASSGSSASAIATRPDENTPADVENKTRDVTDPVGSLGLGADEGESDEEAVNTGFVTCLDGIGEPVTTEQGAEEAPAHAVVRCDLEKLETTGFARFSGGTGGGGFVVGASSFDGRTVRESGKGVVTETVAASEGILFGDPALGGVFIDRVTSTATTTANGLTGSAYVRWERRVEGARTFDPTGSFSESQSCTTIVESGKDVVEEGDCASLEEELNLLFPDRFEVKFPMPEVVATPGGAFASVQQNETDFLSGRTTNSDHRRAVPGMEVTVFADGAQKGRLWVQMAAVRADATFIRSPIQEFGGFEPPVFDDEFEFDDLDAGPLASGPLGGGSPDVQAPDVAPDESDPFVWASHEERLVGAFGWLPRLRSLGQGLLTGVLYLLFLLPIAEVVRRRRLLDVVTDSGPRAA